MSTVIRAALCISCLAAAVLASPVWGQNEAAVEEAYFLEDQERFSALDVLKEALAEKVRLQSASHGLRPEGVLERVNAWVPGSTLVVCFLEGNGETMIKVAGIAKEWNYARAPLTLDFGNPVRRCGVGRSDIKVRIVATSSWSAIGRQNRSNVMRLGVIPPEGLSEAKFRQIVLHEFGHALGLWHELKHASGRCWDEFKTDELKAFYSQTFAIFNEQGIRDAIGTFDPAVMATRFDTTDFDKESVMMYAFPAHLYRNGDQSPCWAPVRQAISDGDKETLLLTVRNPVVTASQLAALAADLSSEDRRLVSAYNALLLSNEVDRGRLLRAAGRLSQNVGASAIASAILNESERLSIREFGQK